MRFSDLMDVLSVVISFSILDKTNGDIIKWAEFHKHMSYYMDKYADRKIEMIMPCNEKNYDKYIENLPNHLRIILK